MNKKFFWSGFISGIIASILIIILVVKNIESIIAPPDVLGEIVITNLDKNVQNIDNYYDKPLIVNYWATWCSPCIKEFPYFESMKQKYSDQINFVMISDEEYEKQINFLNNNNYTFIFLKSEKKLEDYGINIRPATFFYSENGNLNTKHAGSLTEPDLEKLILKIIKD